MLLRNCSSILKLIANDLSFARRKDFGIAKTSQTRFAGQVKRMAFYFEFAILILFFRFSKFLALNQHLFIYPNIISPHGQVIKKCKKIIGQDC